MARSWPLKCKKSVAEHAREKLSKKARLGQWDCLARLMIVRDSSLGRKVSRPQERQADSKVRRKLAPGRWPSFVSPLMVSERSTELKDWKRLARQAFSVASRKATLGRTSNRARLRRSVLRSRGLRGGPDACSREDRSFSTRSDTCVSLTCPMLLSLCAESIVTKKNNNIVTDTVKGVGYMKYILGD
jgi:hypothetical protein